MNEYTNREIMAICAGRLIKDGDVVFAGTGISMLAAVVAKHIHAPRSVVFFETGGLDPCLDELPLAVADPRVMAGTSVNCSLAEALSLLGHPKLRAIAFLGAAQIDRFGNLNSTLLGDYARPKARFPGSGGAADAASLAAGVIVFMEHERHRFVERLDYLTSLGWACGGDSRQRLGFRRGGPLAVVTNLGLLKFDAQTKAIYLSEHYPGISPVEIKAQTGFELDVSKSVESLPPTAQELAILRQKVDPQRLILDKAPGRGA